MSSADRVGWLEAETVVDADVHLTVSEEALASYADEPHASYLRSPSVQLKSPGWDPTLGGKIPSRTLATADEVRTEVCEGLHVDVPVVNVFRNLSRLSQTDTAVHLMRACNDLLLDQFLDRGEFYGLATIATQRPDRAAEEIDRLGREDQVVGVFIPTTGPLPPLGDPTYDVMYAAMEDNGLTPVYHGATNSGFDVGFPTYNRAFESFITAHVTAHLWSQTMTLTSLLVNGIPEKFPGLEFVLLEAGIGWVPYLAYRLNKEAAMRRSEVTLLEHPPEAYIRDRCFFGTQPLGEPMDPEHLGQLVDLVGVESLLFASDYPHWDFDHPGELATQLGRLFEDHERSLVLHENAERVFDVQIS